MFKPILSFLYQRIKPATQAAVFFHIVFVILSVLLVCLFLKLDFIEDLVISVAAGGVTFIVYYALMWWGINSDKMEAGDQDD